MEGWMEGRTDLILQDRSGYRQGSNYKIVVSTLQHVTIISVKFLKPNGIKNREVPYWQKLSGEEKVVKSQVVLKVELKDARIMKFLNVAGINCYESKKIQQVTFHDLDLKGSFE